MKYNMRCKNALVSTSNQRNLGCGEWDYSCNTFIVDSSRIENAINTHPNYIISSFSGTTFNYVTQPTYNYYNFLQTNVTYSITTENQFPVGTGSTPVTNLLNANQKSGRTQVLYTAAELITAGYTAGAINGILLNVSNVGGAAKFFRVNIKHTSLSALSSVSVSTTGFTTVYNQNYSFVNGSNRIQF
jgi:hypothetical protein